MYCSTTNQVKMMSFHSNYFYAYRKRVNNNNVELHVSGQKVFILFLSKSLLTFMIDWHCKQLDLTRTLNVKEFEKKMKLFNNE